MSQNTATPPIQSAAPPPPPAASRRRPSLQPGASGAAARRPSLQPGATRSRRPSLQPGASAAAAASRVPPPRVPSRRGSQAGFNVSNPLSRRPRATGLDPVGDAAAPPNSKPDRFKRMGIGVLIDTDNLMAPVGSKEARNPYYIVYKGRRYYGSSPKSVVRTFREQYAANSGKVAPRKRQGGVVRSFLTAPKSATRGIGQRYANWKQRRADASTAKLAARGACKFLKGDRVVVSNPAPEHGDTRGKIGIVMNRMETLDSCSIVVKMGTGENMTFNADELKMATARDRLGNATRRLGKGFKRGVAAVKPSPRRVAPQTAARGMDQVVPGN